MGTNFQGIEQVGCGCPDLGDNLCGGSSCGPSVRVDHVGDDTLHLEGFGMITHQGGP